MRAAGWACLLGAVALAGCCAGCAQREVRKVRVVEEQQAGPVVEQRPGEMIVDDGRDAEPDDRHHTRPDREEMIIE